MSLTSQRSLDDINEVLQLAKLNETEIVPTSQTIYFPEDNLYDNKYLFLQLDNHLLDEINIGNSLYIKGSPEDNVVICSDNKTYDVTEAETSNSLLLVDNMKFVNDIKDESQRKIGKVEVHGIYHNYLEAVRSKPHLKQLNELLNKSIYKGPEHEYDINKDDLFTHENLCSIIQASRQELVQALSSMNIVTIHNNVRLLDFEYHFRVLSYMLKLIEENSWELDEIDYEETINSLSDLVPNEVLNSLFDKYTEESKFVDGVQLYQYKQDDICKFFAQVLLHNAGKFNLHEFLQAWQESVPEGMETHEEMLYGIAIIDRKSYPNIIKAFSEEDLPENIIDRFKILFETKEKWTVPEIAPYIKRLATEKLDVNALLAKYARASKVDGVKCYSAKHAK